ncbi:MAG: type II secretion system protein GspN [Kofleriaceae bacterium]
MSALDRLPSLGPRGRKVAVVLGFVVLALVSFVMALQLTFPYHRVKDKLVESLSSSYEVQVASVERGIMPGKMALVGLSLRARPTTAGEVPAVLFVERLEVDVGILGLVRGVAAVDVEAKVGKGTISGTVEIGAKGTKVSFVGDEVAADAVPQIRDAAGLPLFGRLDFDVALAFSPGDWRKTTGHIQLACVRGCAVGDGKARLKPKVTNARNAAMVGDGIEFGTVNIDRWLGRIEFAGGKADLARWEFASPDGELELSLAVKLAKQLKESDVTAGCLKFKGTEVLSKREPKTAAALTTTGGVMDAAGLFNIKLDGRLGEIKKRARLCDQDGTDDADGTTADGGGNRRPTLGNIPADDGSPRAGDEVFTKPERPFATIDAQPAPIDAPPIDARPAEVVDDGEEGRTGPPRPPGMGRRGRQFGNGGPGDEPDLGDERGGEPGDEGHVDDPAVHEQPGEPDVEPLPPGPE